MLKAGHAENALPQTATATVNCRLFPGVKADEVQAQLMRVGGNPELEMHVVYEPMEGPMSTLREDVTAPTRRAKRSSKNAFDRC